MRTLTALTRAVPRSIVDCELTHLSREPIDLEKAIEQHGAYEELLESLGCTVVRLPDEPSLPDSVFVEDTALVTDEQGVILRPGAPSRRSEIESAKEALARYRPLSFIEDPGTVDGGDLLRIGRRVFAGLSTRTNRAGIEQLQVALEPFGYRVEPVPVSQCLHLKSAVCQVSDDTVLINPQWVDRSLFREWRQLEVDRSEPFGANALRIKETVMYPSHCARTAERLARAGISLQLVELSELAKAEGGVTCCSIVLQHGGH